MASGTALGGENTNSMLPAALQTDALIQQRVGQARRQVKWVDLLGGLLTLSVGLLAYMLAAAVLDHWVVSGGLSALGRLTLFVVLVGAGGYYCWRRVWPAIRYPINPIYAAQTIERSRPTIKNTLINFLLLRKRREEVSPVVFQALQQRAAAEVAQVPIESVVDWPRVFRLGYILAGVLAAFCLYLIISPKSPLVSAARVLLPWADIQAPTRVSITEVQPGDAIRFHGEFLSVSAAVRGNREDEPVLLVFSTADGQVIDQTIPMKYTGQGDSYAATLPPGSLGLQQNYTYRITCGDCTTRDFRVEVQIPPAIVVEAIDYHYPPYTGLADRTVYRQGDIRAIEGTEVTVHATANQEILRAEIDLGCDGRHNLPMQVKGAQASGRFTLRLSKDDPLRPEFDAYQVRFTDRNRNSNRWPSRHAIEVVPDLSPEVELLEPTQPEVVVPLDGRVAIRAVARDPDFGLRRVSVRALRGETELALEPLLDKPTPQPAHQGDFQGQLVFEPQKLNLKPGDRVAYWVQAEDNKEIGGKPAPNVATTDRRWIIIAPVEAQPQQGQPKPGQQPQPQAPRQDGQHGQPGEDSNRDSKPEQMEPQATQEQQPGDAERQPDADQQRQPAEGQKTEPSRSGQTAEDQQPAEQPEQPAQPDRQQGDQVDQANGQRAGAEKSTARREPIDPQANPGDAIEEINRHRQEQLARQGKQGEPGRQGGPGKQQESSPGGSGQQGSSTEDRQLAQNPEQTPREKQPKPDTGGQNQEGGEKQPSAQQQPSGEKQPKPEGQSSGDKQPAGEKQPGRDTPPTGEKQPPDQQKPDRQPGASGQEKPVQPPPGKQPREEQPSQPPSGQQQPGQDPAQSPDLREPSKTGQDKQSGQQSPGAQTGKQQAAGQPEPKPSGQKPEQPKQQPGTQQQTADKPQPQQSADKPGQSPARPEQGEPGSQSSQPSQKPPLGQPGQKQPVGTEADKPAEPGKQPQDKPAQPQTGGQPNTEQETPASKAEPGAQEGSPEAQADNRQRQRQPAEGPAGKPEPKEKPQSPSVSGRQSDGRQESDSDGDRSGGRSQGGGERSDNPGLGTAGSSTDAQSGGQQSKQPGKGETGTRAGEEVETDKTTGKQAVRRDGQSSDSDKGKPRSSDQPGKQQTQRDAPGGQQQKSDGPQTAKPEGQSEKSGRSGQGAPVTGGDARPNDIDTVVPPPGDSEPGGDDPNLEYARKQTILALEHLKDQLAKEKPDLLDRLGWTPEDARKFIERWEQLYRRAGEASRSPEGKAAKRQLDDALRSLGLRPRGTELRGGQTPQKSAQKTDSGRIAPPAEWAELIREYSRGVAEADR